MHTIPATVPECLYPNSSRMTVPRPYVEYLLPQQANPEQSTARHANVEHNSSAHENTDKETSPEQRSPERTKEETVVLFLARVTQLMQLEAGKRETIAFLHRENEALRKALIQRSCGRGDDDHAGDDTYAHWLRQRTRLERMQALLDRIRAHRAEICRLLSACRFGG